MRITPRPIFPHQGPTAVHVLHLHVPIYNHMSNKAVSFNLNYFPNMPIVKILSIVSTLGEIGPHLNEVMSEGLKFTLPNGKAMTAHATKGTMSMVDGKMLVRLLHNV